MDNHAEVIVIGGGIMGVSLTYQLAKRGKDVLLLEKNELCSGISAATEALMAMRENTHPEYTALGWSSYERYKTLAEELGADFEFQITGGLKLVHNDQEMETAVKMMEESRAAGYDIFRLMPIEEVLEVEPLANPKALAGLYSPYDGTLNPFLLVNAYARAAEKLGARISRFTEVTGFTVRNRRVTEIQTNRGAYTAETVVCAAGYQSVALGKQLDIPVPVHLQKGAFLVTEKLPPIIRHVMFRVVQTRPGNLLIGTIFENTDSPDPRIYPRHLDQLAKSALRDCPSLEGVKVIRSYGGARCLPDDGRSIIGPAKDVENFWLAVSHSVYRLSAALAPLTAEAICGNRSIEDTPTLAYSRFWKDK